MPKKNRASWTRSAQQAQQSHYNALQSTTTHYNALQCTTKHYSCPQRGILSHRIPSNQLPRHSPPPRRRRRQQPSYHRINQHKQHPPSPISQPNKARPLITEQSPTMSTDDLKGKTVGQLKDLLNKLQDLPDGGKKKELIQRLREYSGKPKPTARPHHIFKYQKYISS